MLILRLFCILILIAVAASPLRADDMADLARAHELLNKRNFSGAIKIIKPMAESGDPVAQYYLASVYDGGFGYRPVKTTEALMWNKRSAEQGLREAQAALGDKYYDGTHGVMMDFKEAAKWYGLSADQGFPPAQRSLAQMYELGQGMEADAPEAFRLYISAAEQGHVLAQVDTGRMFATGTGVTKDDRRAVKYFHMAANQRDAAAAIWLGSAYETGNGVEKDLVLAYMWSALAGEFSRRINVSKDSLNGVTIILDNLRGTMSEAQLALAQQMVKDWKPEPDSDKK